MALSARLQLRQTQTLAITPQLLQSIRLLQYSPDELRSFVEAEIARNPLLQPAGSGERSIAGPAAPAPRSGSLQNGRGAASQSPQDLLEAQPEARKSLYAHAVDEVRDATRPGLDRSIGLAIAETLDESGYARIDAEALAAMLGCEAYDVRRVGDVLKAEASPAGLFAEDLADCLKVQLRRRDRLDPVIATVLDNLPLLARRDFAALRRLTNEDEGELLEIFNEIRSLDPKPGHAFDHDASGNIVPEVLISQSADGEWRVDLNPMALPKVLIDRDYLRSVRKDACTPEERSFVSECRESANWLVRSLDQRARTIVKVAAEIVRRQEGFLTRGVDGLKPMTLLSVAEAIGMHESTVSRVTSHKYMATPRGTFEMRFFFTVALASANGGDAHSAESVKHRIKMLIDAETPGRVLSDDDIAATLKDEGVDLARRTVAKYREALGLPSSIQRRREMNARRLAS